MHFRLNLLIVVFPVIRIKLSHSSRLELSVGNDVLSPRDDKRLVSSVSLKNATVKLTSIIESGLFTMY